MGKIPVLPAILLFLQWRPAGLYTTRSRELQSLGMTRPIPKREWLVIGVLALLGLVVLPSLNALVHPGSFFYVSNFTITLYGKYLCYAILAVGVNLLWGYTGLLSLGQCLFFTLGGYALGMHLMLMIGKLGQYHADMPDF